MMKYFIFIFCFLNPTAYAQQASVWYFGKKSGVDFRQRKPVVLSDGALSTKKGSQFV